MTALTDGGTHSFQHFGYHPSHISPVMIEFTILNECRIFMICFYRGEPSSLDRFHSIARLMNSLDVPLHAEESLNFPFARPPVGKPKAMCVTCP
jgi:hypothetical protein